VALEPFIHSLVINGGGAWAAGTGQKGDPFERLVVIKPLQFLTLTSHLQIRQRNLSMKYL
jgi:hypothetical protein